MSSRITGPGDAEGIFGLLPVEAVRIEIADVQTFGQGFAQGAGASTGGTQDVDS